MGSYSYCRKCDAGMSQPTVREVFTNEWYCPQCGYGHDIADHIKADVLCELEERLERIEQHLGLA